MLKSTIAAVVLVMGASVIGQAQANTERGFPNKGTPYAISHDHAKQADTRTKHEWSEVRPGQSLRGQR